MTPHHSFDSKSTKWQVRQLEKIQKQEFLETAETYLPRLHLLCPPPKGHIGVAGARAIPFLLFDNRDEEATFADFPFAAPVIKYFLDQLVILLQQ